MFDHIRCEYHGVPPIEFQTKDTDAQYLENYKIDREGQLWHEYKEYSFEPDNAKEGVMKFLGAMKTTFVEWRREAAFTGKITFYGDDDNKQWWEFSAYFKDGVLQQINQVSPG